MANVFNVLINVRHAIVHNVLHANKTMSSIKRKIYVQLVKQFIKIVLNAIKHHVWYAKIIIFLLMVNVLVVINLWLVVKFVNNQKYV